MRHVSNATGRTGYWDKKIIAPVRHRPPRGQGQVRTILISTTYEIHALITLQTLHACVTNVHSAQQTGAL